MPPGWSRRGFLTTTATGALGVGFGLAEPDRRAYAAGADADAPDEFDTLRQRWADLTLGSGFDPTAQPYADRLAEIGRFATQYRATMAPTDTSLWPDCPFDPPAGITQSYTRLNFMALAHAQPGTGLTGDASLAADVVRGLDHLASTVYQPGTSMYGNWWEWQIGSPRMLLDDLVLMHDQVDADLRDRCLAAIDHFVPDSMLGDYTGTSTGANRVDLCRVVTLRGVLGRTAAKVALARDALSPVFPYVTSGDGLYADGSFIQHTSVAYSGTYGYVLLDGLGRLFHLLAGSTWAVTDPQRQVIYDSVEHAYAPLLHDGLMMDSVSGRAVSRGVQTDDAYRILQSDHQRGHLLIAAIAVLGGSATAAERDRWTGMIKGWIDRDTASPVLTDPQFDVASLARLTALASQPPAAVEEPVGHRLFPAMDRAVHRRPDWTANLAMASNRITYYENGNGENPRGWHSGDGMLSWWAGGATLDQYADDFWPTVDPYRLPGTTVSTKRLADYEGGAFGAPKPDARWVGGTTDGEFSVIGQDVRGLDSTLRAKKSWICVADTIVCLGAGISCRDGTTVETVVDNRNLGAAGADELLVDGVRQPAEPGWHATFRRARWAHLAGHGGYVFLDAAGPGGQGGHGGAAASAGRGAGPGGTSGSGGRRGSGPRRGSARRRTIPGGGGVRLNALREARTGSWHDINALGTDDPVTRRYLTLWLDHGTDPDDAGYGYLLMPGASPARLAFRAADPWWLTVLANSPEAQGVSIRSLGLTAVNFWSAGTVGRLAVGAPASVLVRCQGRSGTVSVAEPPRSGTPFEVRWDRPVRRAVAGDGSVEVLGTGRSLRLRVAPGTACATHTCRVELG